MDRNSVSLTNDAGDAGVALRKESVDRNHWVSRFALFSWRSLSARRAWIEIVLIVEDGKEYARRSPQGERG